MAITLQNNARNAATDAVAALLNGGGYIEFQTAGDVEVATLNFSATAFGAAAAGIATANAITSDTNTTGGTIAKFRAFGVGAVEVFSGTVTATSGGGDIELSSLSIGSGDTLSLSAFTLTTPAS